MTVETLWWLLIWYTFLNGEVIETKVFNEEFESKGACEEMAAKVTPDLTSAVQKPYSFVLGCSTERPKKKVKV